jgi:hypothetical protein
VKHAEQIGGGTAATSWGLDSGDAAREVKHAEHVVGERNHHSGRLVRDLFVRKRKNDR